MGASTLHEISNGRAILGLGTSTRTLTEGLHDVTFTAPADQLRKVANQVRALLDGQRVTTAATAIAMTMTVLVVLDARGIAQHDEHAINVSGKWTMTLEGSPHGTSTMGLTLKQEGKSVTGTFASPHGDMPVKGEFVDKVLTLATTANNEGGEITFKARLKDDGSLSGFLSSSMGDMTWTATRTKEK